MDNGSTDGTAEALKSSYGERVSLVVNETNLGFSRGNNVGIEHARRRGADWVLLLNNDTFVDGRLIDALLETAAAFPDAGILGPKIYYASPPDQIWFGSSYLM